MTAEEDGYATIAFKERASPHMLETGIRDAVRAAMIREGLEMLCDLDVTLLDYLASIGAAPLDVPRPARVVSPASRYPDPIPAFTRAKRAFAPPLRKPMANIPQDLRYTEEHEYVKRTDEEDVVIVGITDYAQGELGDVVFVELPKAGEIFERTESFGTIEAVKAVSDLYSPVAGEVVETNAALDADPALVNTDPYGKGWMVKLRLSDPSELDGLMDASAYEQHIG